MASGFTTGEVAKHGRVSESQTEPQKWYSAGQGLNKCRREPWELLEAFTAATMELQEWPSKTKQKQQIQCSEAVAVEGASGRAAARTVLKTWVTPRNTA